MSSSSDPGSPKDLRSRRREATRQEILEAARSVFAQSGLRDAKMEEIAARAGVSVGTLYNYFDDRQALLESLCDTSHVELLDAIDATLIQNRGRPFADQLHAFVGCVLRHFETHRLIMSAVFEATNDPTRTTPSARQAMAVRMKSLYDRVHTMCDEGLQAGALRPEGATLYPAMLLGMIRGVTLRSYMIDNEPLPSAEAAITDLFLRGASVHTEVKR